MKSCFVTWPGYHINLNYSICKRLNASRNLDIRNYLHDENRLSTSTGLDMNASGVCHLLFTVGRNEKSSALYAVYVCEVKLLNFFMRKQKLITIIFLMGFILFIESCKKQDIQTRQQSGEIASAANSNNQHGHLQQTKKYSSEVVLKWMNMQLRVIRTTAGMPPPTNSRLFAYSGVALYEAVVPGMPAYQSLSGQLTAMPAMQQTSPGFAYHWAASTPRILIYFLIRFPVGRVSVIPLWC
jgi:hypothetical protein